MKTVISSPPHINLAATYDAASMKQLITLSYENYVFLSVDNINRKMKIKAPIVSDTKAPNVLKE